MRLDEIILRIEKARILYNPHHIVHLVAVSKYATTDQIEALYKCGQRAFGESKVQDLERKQNELDRLPLDWHFVGNLQTNKINKLIDLKPSLVHSIESLDQALEFDKRLITKDTKQKALMQINSSYESTKAGVAPDQAALTYRLIREQCTNLELVGVMTIGANSADQKVVAKSFELTKKIYDELSSEGASVLSMGMSSDFELAISHGANLLRIGSVLFDE